VKPKYWLAFPTDVPPLGFSTYYVSYAKGEAKISDGDAAYKSKNGRYN